MLNGRLSCCALTAGATLMIRMSRSRPKGGRRNGAPGAHEYVASAVESVEPFDVSGTASALEAVMVAGQKPDIDSVSRTREAVRADTPVKWLTAALAS